MLLSLNWDQTVLMLSKLFRMIAYGQTAIILVSFLGSLGWTDETIGFFMSLTLIGDVCISMAVGAISHINLVSRRNLLIGSCLMLLGSGIVFATSSNYLLLLTAAILGVISPSGDEVGPFISIESAILAHITPYEQRAYLFAIQGMLGTCGLALGMASGGWISDNASKVFGIDGHRLIFWLYAGWAGITLALVCSLSSNAEVPCSEVPGKQVSPEEIFDESIDNETAPLLREANEEQPVPPVSQGSEHREDHIRYRGAQKRSLSSVLSLIFGLDSLAYGFMSNSWLVEYMHRRYDASTTVIGQFMFFSQFISALTSVPSVWMTQLYGPVLAIALTKFGAGAFGAAVPLAGSMTQAMGCILFRSLFDTMDVVPRQLFLTSVVPQEQTVAVLSLVNIVKTFARAVAPIGTGILAARDLLWVAFIIMGTLEWAFGGAVLGLFL